MIWRLFYYILFWISASKLIDNVSFVNCFILIKVIFNIIVVSFFWRLKSVTYFKLSLIVTIKIITSNSMKFIFIVYVILLGALFMNFCWLDLICGFVLHCWSKNSGLIFLLILYNTEEKINHTDWIQLFVLIKVYKSNSADFSFSCPNSLHFNFYKINIFFHYKIINCFVSNLTFVLFVNLLNNTQHLMSTSFYHVFIINSWYCVWETFHFFIM